MTNFKNITGTPRKFAEFIASIPKHCDETGDECDRCQLAAAGECCNVKGILNWLLEESDD